MSESASTSPDIGQPMPPMQGSSSSDPRGTGLRRWLAWLCLDRPTEVRQCPHCLEVIPERSNFCPRCRRVIRFEGIDELRRATEQPHTSP